MIPPLSIVVTARNDDHGNDLLPRMHCFADGIYEQFEKYKIEAELLFVEWNPPQNTARLKDVMPAPPADSPVSVKYISVPGDVHRRFRNSDSIPLFQMIAKNVGIRRAKNEWILCTNVDLLFSNELMAALRDNDFVKGNYYRARRFDIPEKAMEIENFEQRLKFCEKNVIKKFGKTPYDEMLYESPRWLGESKTLISVMNKVVGSLKKKVDYEWYLFSQIDMMACGDFTLMHRNDWEKIKGYPELEMYSIHIDSLALISASAAGLKQKLFPADACTYHIHHTNGWHDLEQNPEKKIRFMEKRPCIDFETLKSLGKKLLVEKKIFEFNNENWGLNDEKLVEYPMN